MIFLRGSPFVYLVVVIVGTHFGLSTSQDCQFNFRMCRAEFSPFVNDGESGRGCRLAAGERRCMGRCLGREDLMGSVETNVVGALNRMCNDDRRIELEIPSGETSCFDTSGADECDQAFVANLENIISANDPATSCSVIGNIWNCLTDGGDGCTLNVIPHALTIFNILLEETVISQIPMCSESRRKRSVEFVKRK